MKPNLWLWLCIGMIIVLGHSAWVAGASVIDVFYGNTTRISVRHDGDQTIRWSLYSVISGNGATIAFTSADPDIVANDTNQKVDVFVRDLDSGITERVSLRNDGVETTQDALTPSISHDGRWVAFSSRTAFDGESVLPKTTQLFLRDRSNGVTQRLSVNPMGDPENADCELMPHAISHDGRWVVFSTKATNLIPQPVGIYSNVYLYERDSNELTILSLAMDGTPANGDARKAQISGDGRYVVFESEANNLVPEDTNGTADIFVWDRITGERTRVSINSAGEASNGTSRNPGISADGHYLFFISNATNLADNLHASIDVGWDLYRHERVTGETRLVSEGVTVVEPYLHWNGDISADGQLLVFESLASTLVPSDTNNAIDIFRKDMNTGLVERVSVDSFDLQANRAGYRPSVSGDGRRISWDSEATNLVSDDTNSQFDVFLREETDTPPPHPLVLYAPLIGQGQWLHWEPGATRVTGHATGNSWGASVDGSGGWVVFVSDATNLAGSDFNGFSDVYLWHRPTNRFRRVSRPYDGNESNGSSYSPKISDNGRFIVFASQANNLVANDTNGQEDIFRYDLLTGETILVSVGLEGVGGNDGSNAPDISADGRWIVFASSASNLTTTPYPQDCTPGPCRTLYWRDMETGITETLVRNQDGTAAVPLADPAITDDGQRVVYAWEKAVDYAGRILYETYVYQYVVTTGQNYLISSPQPTSPYEYCLLPTCGHTWQDAPRISGDGQAIGFYRLKMAISQYGGEEQRGIQTVGNSSTARGYGITVCLGVGAPTPLVPTGGYGVTDIAFSRNGSVSTFAAEDLNLMGEKPCGAVSTPQFPDDGNGVRDVYLSHTSAFQNGTPPGTQRVSSDASGAPGNGHSYDVAVSGDGYTVAYTTEASNVAAGDANGGVTDIVVWSWR